MIVLSLTGAVIASILTLFQLHAIGSVWDPFFGDGSRKVLTSSLSQALPLPDASLGAAAYLIEAILESIGGQRRALDTPSVVIAAGLVAAGLGVAAIVLIMVQAVVVGAFCTLCLASAAISLGVAVVIAPEVRTSVRAMQSRRHRS